MFYVYVLWSEKFKRTYTGTTRNFERRFKEHNLGKVSSSKPYVPYTVLILEEHSTIRAAYMRERYYKSSSGRRDLKHIVQQRANGESAAAVEQND